MPSTKSLDYYFGENPNLVARLLFVNEIYSFTQTGDMARISQLMFEHSRKWPLIPFLVLTGSYPSRHELSRFKSQIDIFGWERGAEIFLEAWLEMQPNLRNFNWVILKKPATDKCVDVTSTFLSPFVTGVQRVTHRIIEATEDKSVTLLLLDVTQKIYRQISRDELLFRSNFYNRSLSKDLNIHTRARNLVLWNLDYFGGLLRKFRSVSWLYRLLLPYAKHLRRRILQKSQIRNSSHSDQVIESIFIPPCSLTIIDIPQNDGSLEILQAIASSSEIYLQMVVHDFISLFFDWTTAPGTSELFNKYLALVIRSDRLIGVSKLVGKQTSLIVEAARLQIPNMNKQQPSVLAMSLPSGLASPKTNIEYRIPMPYFLVLGSFDPRKNHWLVLDAAEYLFEIGICIELVFVGHTGWNSDELFARIDKLNSAKKVSCKVLRNVNDQYLVSLIKNARGLILVSEAEGSGLPIREALALNTPVITHDLPPMNEITSEKLTLVNYNDTKCLAEAILNHLREEARDMSKQEFAALQSNTWHEWSEILFNS